LTALRASPYHHNFRQQLGMNEMMNDEGSKMNVKRRTRKGLSFIIHHSSFIISLALLLGLIGCQQIGTKLNVQPRALRDVPAARLAFRLEPDVSENVLPLTLTNETPDEPLAPVKQDFETRRKDEALLRTVQSPDGQRALALYDPGGLPSDEFKLDLYAADGRFLRNLLPENLSGAFLSTAVWSPDGQWIAFIGRKTEKPQPTPTPLDELLPTTPVDNSNAAATPTVQPLLPAVPMFTTEQVYLCDRDGFNLRPLTTREGLVYFALAWASDAHALAALACTEQELAERINENKLLAGRPRLIDRNGQERLLDDQLMDALPVWSPDSAKVATASDTDVLLYDALGDAPTGARISLRDPLLKASTTYDAQKLPGGGAANPNTTANQPTAPQTSGMPLSFNPIVRLEWVQPETLLVQTGFVRVYQNNEEVRRYLRWHVLHLSPQAVVLK
jgi:WD40-like Beta Propeller Repeat